MPVVDRIRTVKREHERDHCRYDGIGRRVYKGKCGKVKSFRIWAIFTFLFFLLSMVFGLIGLCCCCPYLTDTSFYDFFY